MITMATVLQLIRSRFRKTTTRAMHRSVTRGRCGRGPSGEASRASLVQADIMYIISVSPEPLSGLIINRSTGLRLPSTGASVRRVAPGPQRSSRLEPLAKVEASNLVQPRHHVSGALVGSVCSRPAHGADITHARGVIRSSWTDRDPHSQQTMARRRSAEKCPSRDCSRWPTIARDTVFLTTVGCVPVLIGITLLLG